MTRSCTVCHHENREDIDKMLLNGRFYREIATKYGLSISAVKRHRDGHLQIVPMLQKQDTTALESISVQDELKNIFEKIKKMLNACDEWLQDPDNPEKYDLSARSEEITVNYSILNERGKEIRKKALLSTLLSEIYLQSKREINSYELIATRHSDPRELILQVSANLQKQLELILKLTGQLDEKPTVNIAIANNPQWIEIRDIIVKAVEPYPNAKSAIITALQNVKSSTN